MKILLVTTVLSKGVVGPAKFSRILRDSSLIDCDILVEGERTGPGIIPVEINQGYFKRKLSLYNRIKPYQDKIIEIADHYDVILFSSGILAYKMPKVKAGIAVMINDDNYLSASPQWDKYRMIDYFYKKLEKDIVNNSPNIIVNSKYLKTALIKTYGCSPDKITRLYKAIDLKNLELKDRLIDTESKIRILFVKNDFERGGLMDLIQALEILTDYRFDLSIVGCSPSLDRSPANINFNIHGGVPHSQVLNMMASHDIFCVPSRREALGVANMEAMSAGIPVVTTNVGGIPEVITEAEGWISEPSNPIALSECIKACLTNADLRIRKKNKAYEKVKMFSEKNMLENLKDILQQLKK